VLRAAQAQILEAIPVQTEVAGSDYADAGIAKRKFDEVVLLYRVRSSSLHCPSSESLCSIPAPKNCSWQRIAKEAAEQSERSLVPAILEPVSFTTGLAASTATHRYLCVAHVAALIKNAINSVSTTGGILIATVQRRMDRI